MTHQTRRLTLMLLCAAIAFGGPLSRAVAADDRQPCMAMPHDGAAMPDCDYSHEKAAACADHCAPLFAAVVIPANDAAAPRITTGEIIVVATAGKFKSRAGPPGLQPPR